MSKLNAHLKTVDETYVEHATHALHFSGKLAIASFVCLIHAIFPFMFEKTGSKMITQLHDKMVTNRLKKSAQASQSA